MIRPLPLAATLIAAAALALFSPAQAPAQEPLPVLTEEEAVRLALAGSPTLEIARRERNVGLIEADRNRPAFRPEVTASASQTLRTPRVDLPGRTDDVVLPNSLSRFEIGVKQPLYQFGAGKAPGQRAGAMAAAARSEFRKAELDTVLEAREAYLSVQRAEALAGVAKAGVGLSRENLRITELSKEAGFQADVDVLEARRNLEEAESGVVQSRSGAELARANLNRVLGRKLETGFQAAPPSALPPDPPPLDTLTAQAATQRPELETLRQNIREAEAGIRLAKAAGQPRISLEAAYALQTETALVPGSGFAAGVSITAPLFNRPIQRHTVKEAEERLAQLRSAVTAREQGIALEIQRQRLAISDARARIRVAERARELAEKELEITRLRLERGHAIQLEMQAKRLAVEKALGDRVQAENDVRLASVRLDRALGIGPASTEPVPTKR